MGTETIVVGFLWLVAAAAVAIAGVLAKQGM